jgi:NAD(P)-dependent dehydrogenase (short-subunit alcohol dehydrogenase family)
VRDGTGSPGTVLVLGGGSDIGLAIARRFVHDGARTLVLAGRDPDRMRAAAEQLLDAGAGCVDRVAFDADDVDDHGRMLEAVVARHGDLDVVVLAFGVLGDQLSDEVDAAKAVQVHRTTVLGGVSVLTHLGQLVRRQGHGDIVVLSSVAAMRARRANYVYGSAKAGLDAFASGLSDALVGSGGHLLVVRPGFVRSAMTAGRPPAPLATEPDAVADAVVAALARRAHTVHVPRSLGLVMGGLRLLPRTLFRRLSDR